MAKTRAEIQAKWREKNPEKLKQRRKVYNKSYLARVNESLTEQEREEAKKKNADRIRCWRAKKTQGLSEQNQQTKFRTPQLRGKLMKKARLALTGTPLQNKEVLSTLLNEYHDVEPAQRTNGHELSEETLKKVVEFYHSDNISRTSPNVKDFVTIIENGQKQKVSVKHLLYPIKECYGMFCSDNPHDKIGLSKFFESRPINILSTTEIPQNVCVCQIHENLRCALKSLKLCDPAFDSISTDYSMHKNFVCENPNEGCFKKDCESCSGYEKFREMFNATDGELCQISWHKWIEVKGKDQGTPYCNIEKIKKTGTIKDLEKDILDQVPGFLLHEFIKICQSKACNDLIQDSLMENSETAVIICDFAEKFKCLQQNATQSAHYGQTPVTLFTVAIYHKEFKSVVIASDFEKNTKECVLAFIYRLLKTLPDTVKSTHFWSDNASSQFKNQFIMQGLLMFEEKLAPMKLFWHFFAAMHGKSVVDGVGGSVKRFVRQKILSKNLIVKNSTDFHQVASDMNVKVLLVNKPEIKKINEEIKLSEIVNESKPVKDIKKLHSFKIQKKQIGKKKHPEDNWI